MGEELCRDFLANATAPGSELEIAPETALANYSHLLSLDQQSMAGSGKAPEDWIRDYGKFCRLPMVFGTWYHGVMRAPYFESLILWGHSRTNHEQTLLVRWYCSPKQDQS